MGLIEQEIKELREINVKIDAGKISFKDVNAKIAVYSQTEKRVRIMLQIFDRQIKHGSDTLPDLLSDGSMINHGK
jgi:hypothetical protein